MAATTQVRLLVWTRFLDILPSPSPFFPRHFRTASAGVSSLRIPKTVCPSGLRGWTQVPLAQAAWVQIPQLSYPCCPVEEKVGREFRCAAIVLTEGVATLRQFGRVV